MPPKTAGNKKSNSKDPNDWQKWEFAQINLGAEDKEKFKAAYAKDAGYFLDAMRDYAQNGYKFSVVWDGTGNCFLASMSCKEPGDPNFNYVLTSRSPDFWEAQALNVYKTRQMCADEIWTDGTEEGNWG